MNEIMTATKIFSDSMIALHDDSESIKSYSQNQNNANGIEDEKSSNEWLNDWDQDDKIMNLVKPESSASLVSLAGSFRPINSTIDFSKQKAPAFYQINDTMGAEYDIKSINIVKKTLVKNPEDDLIENFLNEMKPNLDLKSQSHKNEHSSNSQAKSDSQWECDEEINLDEL